MNAKLIGRGQDCDYVLEHESASRHHAHAQVTEEGYLAVQDADSANGTFLQRHGQWIRIKKVVLGTQDRIRFGEEEVSLDELVALFTGLTRVRLREGYSVRGKPLVFDQLLANMPKPKIVLENPRRNPVTGNIEEDR
jgi:pSer/pThr/pTyr-binding forkhead associated (FHA) protein